MTRRRGTLGWTAVLVVVVVLLALLGLKSDKAAVSGRAAPQLPREHIGGAPATLSSLIGGAGGRASLVVFWASWCGPCTKEAPAIEQFASSSRGRGRIVGVDWSDALSGARAFIRHYSWTFPNLRDGEGLVGNNYHLTGLPTTFVLDSQGRIRDTLRGPQDSQSLSAALAEVERA
jgi:thiol-disulfide isomerase/thioredoxin